MFTGNKKRTPYNSMVMVKVKMPVWVRAKAW